MDKELKSIISLYKTVISLKELPRQGWIMEGASRNEADSVAAHSYFVAIVSYLTAKSLEQGQGLIRARA